MKYDERFNAEGYSDPTAFEAIRNIELEEQTANRRAGLLLRIFHDILTLAGFVSLLPLKVREKKTGRVYQDKQDKKDERREK